MPITLLTQLTWLEAETLKEMGVCKNFALLYLFIAFFVRRPKGLFLVMCVIIKE